MDHRTQHSAKLSTLMFAIVVLLSGTTQTSADALDKMELVFEGNYSRSTIEKYVVTALKMYGEQNTEDNRSRLGSVLVTMRKENGVPEMDILKCMVSAHMGVKVQEAAAICTTLLVHD